MKTRDELLEWLCSACGGFDYFDEEYNLIRLTIIEYFKLTGCTKVGDVPDDPDSS